MTNLELLLQMGMVIAEPAKSTGVRYVVNPFMRNTMHEGIVGCGIIDVLKVESMTLPEILHLVTREGERNGLCMERKENGPRIRAEYLKDMKAAHKKIEKQFEKTVHWETEKCK